MNRRDVVKAILWSFVGATAVIAFVRFTKGLGAVTALTDTTPWGIWVAFDVMAGVALAAGGFVVAACVYIFHLEKYKPIVRPAVLTAFLGYGAVIAGLMFDLGLPWRIWHATIYWQHHSVLFEVAWCVMLYFHVLALEFAPVVLEHSVFQRPLFQRIYRILKKATIPLVILGIVLSTLHQSSLGSLFLIVPFRLHALWYSPLLPLLFFVSAIGLGLMMVTLESLISAWLFQHPVHKDLLSGLGKAASYVLCTYFLIRVGDLYQRGQLGFLLEGSWQSAVFVIEILISTVIPAVLLMKRKWRENTALLTTAAVLTVSGMIMYRIDVGLVAIARVPGMAYFPAWTEIVVSLGIVSGAGLIFIFCAEHLALFDPTHMPEIKANPYAKPVFDPVSKTWLGDRPQQIVRPVSLAFVLAVAVTAAVLPTKATSEYERPPTPVQGAVGWDVLRIDGNRMLEYTLFPHADHIKLFTEKYGEREGCVRCHHMSKPKDGPTSCWECHSDMYLPTSIFNHDRHRDRLGGTESCVQCHPAGDSKQTDTVRKCDWCHKDMFQNQESGTFNYIAPSYIRAMHGTCTPCHMEQATEVNREDLANCATCHTESAYPKGRPMLSENVDRAIPLKWYPQSLSEF